MKIIRVDNYDRESESDKLICENVNEYWGKAIVSLLNEKYSGDNSSDYFRLVDNDYKLYVFQP